MGCLEVMRLLDGMTAGGCFQRGQRHHKLKVLRTFGKVQRAGGESGIEQPVPVQPSPETQPSISEDLTLLSSFLFLVFAVVKQVFGLLAYVCVTQSLSCPRFRHLSHIPLAVNSAFVPFSQYITFVLPGRS